VSSAVDFLDLTIAEWDRIFDINMRGAFLVTRRVVPAMLAAGVGRIVSVSSAAAQRGAGTYSKVPYSASKAALIGFSRALARELGPHGITVNCVAPGPIDTDIMGGTLTEERKAELGAHGMVGRVGTVAEVAALMAFLLGEDAGYITAATYDINGGLQVS
jgi:NAD(P)-dependent dehydrogenase (short-subunit alcohol dehydrogenase family)